MAASSGYPHVDPEDALAAWKVDKIIESINKLHFIANLQSASAQTELASLK